MTFLLQQNIVLAPYTSLKIGGPAEYLCEAMNDTDAAEALEFAHTHGVSIHVLGGGTNTLVADEGVLGVTVLMRNRSIAIDGTRMTVGAGTLMGEVVAKTVKEGLAGLAWAGGLPGTLGGAVFGNAGTFGHAIGDIVRSVHVMHFDGHIEDIPQSECRFHYRSSCFKKEPVGLVILSAVLQLQPGDEKKLRDEMMRAIAFRNEHHPAPSSAGSFFQNPEAPEYFSGPIKDGHGFHKIPAGWLVEHAGLKGMRIRGAKISEKHANFIVNEHNATAEDVRVLAQQVKDRVREKYGVELEEEVRYLK